TRHREAGLLQLCLETRQPFVVDNTNATISQRARYIDGAKAGGFRVVGYFFEPNIAESLKRNEQRSGAERIPKVGIFATYKRLQRPSLSEGFDQLFRVTLPAADVFVIEPWAEEASG